MADEDNIVSHEGAALTLNSSFRVGNNVRILLIMEEGMDTRIRRYLYLNVNMSGTDSFTELWDT